MNSHKTLHSILATSNKFEAFLSQISEAEFQSNPSADSWSYSEVYSHIFDSNMLSLQAIKQCSEGKGISGKTTFAFKLLSFLGTFPPKMRFKVPQRLIARVQKISKDEAQALIQNFNNTLASDYQRIAAAKPEIKVKHPRLGLLNATEWLTFIDIHFKHHLKQLSRIKKTHKN